MSVWTEIDGIITIPKSSHHSLEKSFASCCGSLDFTYNEKHVHEEPAFRTVDVHIALCEDSIRACYVIQDWIHSMPKNSRVDITSEVRWIK